MVFLAAMYLLAAIGAVCVPSPKWYSTGGQVAVAKHTGQSKPIPAPSLTSRRHLPPPSPLVLHSVALLGQANLYPVERPILCNWVANPLQAQAACLLACLSDRAPPAA